MIARAISTSGKELSPTYLQIGWTREAQLSLRLGQDYTIHGIFRQRTS
jgi:hypothetical protein